MNAMLACWPSPGWPYPDPELQRLRRLKEQRQREEEKAELRRWLRDHGVVDPCFPPCSPWVPVPVFPVEPRWPYPGPIQVGDVVRQIR